MAGHTRSIRGSSSTPSTSRGTAACTDSNASTRSERMSKMSSPAGGTTLKASPERMIVGTTLSRSGPDGSWSVATSIAAWASARRALRPWSGALPEWAARPEASTLQRPGRLAPDDDPLLALGAELAGLEAQAGVVALEAPDVHERLHPPLLVVDEQHGELGE